MCDSARSPFVLVSVANSAAVLKHGRGWPRSDADARTDGEAWRVMELSVLTEALCSPSSLSFLFIQAGGLQQRKQQSQQ